MSASTELAEAPSAAVDLLDRFQTDIAQIVTYGESIVITSTEEVEAATEVVARISRTRKAVKDQRLKITRPLDQAKKAALDQEKEVLAPLEPLDRMLRDGIGNFHALQERKRRQEQERIERERREAEAKARAEAEAAEREARRLEYEAGRRKTEEAQARQEEKAEEALQAAEVARLQEKVAQEAPVKKVESSGPTTRTASGTASTRMVWGFEIIDSSEIPRNFLKVDESAIRDAVRSGVREIPGVKIEQKPQVAVR
jgi:flagellar biosynthesis GTPase FlhF